MKTITATIDAERVARLIADDVLAREAPGYLGVVRCRMTRVPEQCAPEYWRFHARIELPDAPDAKPAKTKRSRKAKGAA